MDPDLTPTPTRSSDDIEMDTPPRPHTQPISPSSFSKGTLKNRRRPPPPPLVAYKECMKNHAATRGGHAVDGCGEYLPSPSAAPNDPASLSCAACGCHRNFHRRELRCPTAITPPFLDFRHPSPAPSTFAHARHGMLGLGTSVAAEEHREELVTPMAENVAGRKRFRTKFSQEQKQKMHSFSEKLGWKMHKSDDAAVEEFCREVGVAKGVLKVWMHNNKTTFGKKEGIHSSNDIINSGLTNLKANNGGENSSKNEENNCSQFQNESGSGIHIHDSHNVCSS